MKGLRIGRRRTHEKEQKSSPVELALRPAIVDDRWQVPDRFNFTRDVVEALAHDPKRPAVTIVGSDGVIEPRTFLDISEGAARWAEILRERGVHPDDRVVVVAGSSVDWVEVVLGTFKVGAIAVFCPPSLAAGALEARVSATEPALVVAEHASEATIAQMSFTTEVHYFDDGRRRRASDVPEHSPTRDTASKDLAFVVWTAGVTGQPKGVAHTHASVFATRVQAEHWLEAGRGDVVWCTAPTDSPMALWHAVVGPWSRGAEVVLHQGEFDARDHLDLLYRLGPTILCQSPAEYRGLAGLRELERYRPPRLRRLLSTGDHLEPEIVEAFQERWGMTIHDGYGQAETNIVVGAQTAEDPVGSLGRPLPGHHVAIIDSEGNELPPGIEGDLAVRGRPPTLFAGYWELPEETKSAFRGDWYVTGDVAVQDEEGTFRFVGRAEDVITSRGRTFGPFEVEHALRSHPAIAASAVIGVRDLQRGGHFVRAYVVPARATAGTQQHEAELREFVADALLEQQVPREIVFVDELPTAGGKVSRHSLRERPVAGRPLWETTPAGEPQAAPFAPVAEAAPLAPPEPEPVVFTPEPEPVPFVPEPGPVAFEPEPVAFVPEPEPIAPEPEPAPPEPEPVVFVPEPEPVAFVPEPGPVVVEPEPERAAPAPEHTPEFGAATEPSPLPDYVVGPASETGPPPAPEPVTAQPEPDPGPLPDYVVAPETQAEPEVHIRALPDPEPEPERDLGPLPDFVIDPDQPQERREPAPEQLPNVASAPPVDSPQSRDDSSAASAGLYFPPVTSFPVPREEPDAPADEPRRPPRRRPAADLGPANRKGVPAEPGDEADEVGWMQGLSNRLSAYSFSAEEQAAREATSETDGTSESPEEPEDSV